MLSDNMPSGLTGTLLAAMPAIQDPTFGRSVVLVCAHSPEGAMGVIINSPLEEDRTADVFAAIGAHFARRAALLKGGPAETERPFVLHSPDWRDGPETLRIDRDHAMTASPAALNAIAAHEGPARALVVLGYSAWGPGQLEREVRSNVWLTSPADPDIVFNMPSVWKWQAVVRSTGAPPEGLSGTPGRA